MNRVNQILFHPRYRQALEQTEILEQDRKFCRHGIAHFLDVARLAYIHSLEEGLDVDKDVIYAAALLHDIGRYQQYERGIPHERASADLAGEILPQCSFSEKERVQIQEAISGHRRQEDGEKDASALGGLLYRADKMSRNCFACPAREECNWPEDKMNMEIKESWPETGFAIK